MKELRTIIEEYSKIDFSQRKAALATVVKVRGSSYRSPGARMLITDDGKWVGSISGGCLEGDALRKARQVMTSHTPLTVTYDTREESNQKLGIGLGCNGVIDVLIEPLAADSASNGTVRLFHELLNGNETYAMATITHSTNLNADKLLITEGMQLIRSFKEEALASAVLHDIPIVFTSRKSLSKCYAVDNKEFEVFIELIQPAITLMIFGGGFDARPVTQLAKSLGWNVAVTDECVAHIAPIFFPAADKLTLCDRSFIDRDFNITNHTACVLMSHNYDYDRDVLRKLLKTPTPYIGILGPRKRFDKMLAEFTNEGLELSSDDFARIHSPIGLDIGAETPDEIAIAIIGEVQGKFSNRSGGFLKYRQGPIHEREGKQGEISKQFFIYRDESSRATGA
jgi:xanthine dehydrogenase accessory factor